MIYQGRNLIIKAGGVAIAAAKSCDLVVSVEEREVSNPSNGQWARSIFGRKSWKVSTNQLLTGLVRHFSMLGTTVTIDVCIQGEYGSSFAHVVDNPTVTGGGVSNPDYMVWDKTRKKFLAATGTTTPTYYETYTFADSTKYSSPQDNDVFHDSEGNVYSYYNGNLNIEKLTGNANVVRWDAKGGVGNLCQGNFQFNGNGPLTPASLPTT